MKDVYILAIESSCDETSMAIVKNGSIVGAVKQFRNRNIGIMLSS